MSRKLIVPREISRLLRLFLPTAVRIIPFNPMTFIFIEIFFHIFFKRKKCLRLKCGNGPFLQFLSRIVFSFWVFFRSFSNK